MEKRTIAEVALEVLKETKQPMTAAEITQAILDKGLYSFNVIPPGVRQALIEFRHCDFCLRNWLIQSPLELLYA